MSSDFLYEVSTYDQRGHKPLVKFGHILSTTGGVFEVVWPGGTRTLPTSALPVRIKAGGTAADTAGGTGAKEIIVEGLDANYQPVSEAIATNGISASAATTAAFLRLDRAYVTKVGSGGVNAGNITIEQTGGTVMNFIEANEGQTQMAALTVPAGSTMVVVGSAFSLADTPGAGKTQRVGQFRGRIRLYDESSNNNYQSWRTVFNLSLDSAGTGSIYQPQPLGIELPEKTDVQVEVYSHDASAQADCRLFVVENV